jgi:hypothetical protein
MRRRARSARDNWGVWLAEWTGPAGEMILVAMTSSRVRVAEETVPLGGNHVDVQLRLLEQLEAVEPNARPILRAI